MSEEYAYWGNNENCPCEFHNWIVDHPQIKAVRLKWSWNNRCKYFAGGLKFGSHMDSIDLEYSFAGLREDALKFLKSYDCWDGIQDKIDLTMINEYGILDVEYTAEDPTYFDFNHYDDDPPEAWDIGDLLDNQAEDIAGLVYQWCKDHDEVDRLNYHYKRAGL